MINLSRSLIAAATIAVTVSAGTLPAVAHTAQIHNLYLGVGASESAANLNWTSAGTHTEYVQWAPTASLIDGALPADSPTVAAERGPLTITGARYARSAAIAGLAENTHYSYRVGSDERGWSPLYEFTTGTFGDTWDFVFFGDPQIGASQMGVRSARLADGQAWVDTASIVDERHPNAAWWLSAGDQVDYFFDGQIQQHEYSLFFTPDQLRTNRLAVNRGNHDISKAYGEMFNLPNAQPRTLISPHHYFFEHNNALIIALDTNTVSDAEFEEQKRFLRNTVTTHGGDKDWIIVTYHHSTYSQAYHQTDTIVQKYRNEGMVDLLSELGVDVVLSGHDHIHTRSHLMNGTQPTSQDEATGPGDVLYPSANDVLYLTATSSTGSKFYEFAHTADGRSYTEYPDITTMEQSDEAGLTADATAYWVQDNTPDYTHIEVSPATLTLSTYNVADGTLVDNVTLRKDSANPAPAPADQDGGGSTLSVNEVESALLHLSTVDTRGSSQFGLLPAFAVILAIAGMIGMAAFHGQPLLEQWIAQTF